MLLPMRAGADCSGGVPEPEEPTRSLLDVSLDLKKARREGKSSGKKKPTPAPPQGPQWTLRAYSKVTDANA